MPAAALSCRSFNAPPDSIAAGSTAGIRAARSCAPMGRPPTAMSWVSVWAPGDSATHERSTATFKSAGSALGRWREPVRTSATTNRLRYAFPPVWLKTSWTRLWCGAPPIRPANWNPVLSRSRGPSAIQSTRGRRRMSASQRSKWFPTPGSPLRRVAMRARRLSGGPAIRYISTSRVLRSAQWRSSMTSTTGRRGHS